MPVGSKFFERHGRHFQMQVDAVEQRSADFAEIALDDPTCAAALARGIAEEAAWTSVQVTSEVSMNRACDLVPIQVRGVFLWRGKRAAPSSEFVVEQFDIRSDKGLGMFCLDKICG